MQSVNRAVRPGGPVIRQCTAWLDGDEKIRQAEIEYLTFPGLTKTGMVKHLFTTRLGGVSKGIYTSMNLSFTRGDEPWDVLENYRRIARILGIEARDVVCSDQTHTTNIRTVTEDDRGKGVTRPRDYHDVDGLVTDIAGIALATFYADCVPLYFVDTHNRAIGLAHSGWRGTVDRMGECMVRRMGEEFGTKPEDLLAAVGPSICQGCYEVGEDVAAFFEAAFQGSQDVLEEITQARCYDSRPRQILVPGRASGKYQLDLWLANLVILRQAGIPLANIFVTDLCTCHNPDYLFSHRASQGKRGNLGAFLMLNNS